MHTDAALPWRIIRRPNPPWLSSSHGHGAMGAPGLTWPVRPRFPAGHPEHSPAPICPLGYMGRQALPKPSCLTLDPTPLKESWVWSVSPGIPKLLTYSVAPEREHAYRSYTEPRVFRPDRHCLGPLNVAWYLVRYTVRKNAKIPCTDIHSKCAVQQHACALALPRTRTPTRTVAPFP